MNKYLSMMNNGTSTLDEILNAQPPAGEKGGIESYGHKMSKKLKFVPDEKSLSKANLLQTRKGKEAKIFYFCNQKRHLGKVSRDD